MSGKIWYVDRLEGEKVVCEDNDCKSRVFLKSDFSFEIHEGAVLEEASGGGFTLNTRLEEERREQLSNLQQNLFDN